LPANEKLLDIGANIGFALSSYGALLSLVLFDSSVLSVFGGAKKDPAAAAPSDAPDSDGLGPKRLLLSALLPESVNACPKRHSVFLGRVPNFVTGSDVAPPNKFVGFYSPNRGFVSVVFSNVFPALNPNPPIVFPEEFPNPREEPPNRLPVGFVSSAALENRPLVGF
jgi:hypothetical protein